MSITLPWDNQEFPLLRILTRETWGGDATSGAGWIPQQMARAGRNGFEVVSWERACLPEIGRAEIVFQYGRIVTGAGPVIVAPSVATQANLQAGEPWDPEVDTLEVPDLRGHEIRIQAAPMVEAGVTPEWRTVWWGQCEEQLDSDWPGASIPAGKRTYHCLDGFARTRRWMMNRHGYYDGAGGAAINCPGHPGFNVNPHQSGKVSANKYNSTYPSEQGSAVTNHAFPGTHQAAFWTDKQALEEQAWVATRPTDDVKFTISGATELFSSFGCWPVNDESSVWDFTAKMCRRSRGLGLLYPDWEDDSGSPNGALTAKMTAAPQIMEDINYLLPAGGAGLISGSTTAGRTIAVDLIGDHRLIAESFQMGDQYQYWYDYLETQGEPIEVMVTLDHYSFSLDKAWTDAAATDFRALDLTKRGDEKYRYIYQLHQLNRAFTWSCGDGNGANEGRVDFSCNDAGYIMSPSGSSTCSPLLLKVLDDLPLLEGYKYDSALTEPTRDDAGNERTNPRRRDPQVYIRTADNRYKVPGGEGYAGFGDAVEMKISSDGILLYSPKDHNTGFRTWGDTAYSTLASLAKYLQLILTVTLRLPHRVRLASGQSEATERKRALVIRHPDFHLWLAHQEAIWDLDGTTLNMNGCQAKRDCLAAAKGTYDTANIGLLRDDRDELAKRHALARCWYQVGVALEDGRRTAQWALRACGALGSFEQEDGTQTTYAKIGDTISTLSAAGQVYAPKTPVTRIHYDAVRGVTTWFTNWTDLDFSKEGMMG